MSGVMSTSTRGGVSYSSDQKPINEALATARRKLALRDWNLRLKPTEAEALRAWIWKNNDGVAELKAVQQHVRRERDNWDGATMTWAFLQHLNRWLVKRIKSQTQNTNEIQRATNRRGS